MGIKQKLAVLFLVISLIPMLFLGFFMYGKSRTALATTTKNQLDSVASQLDARVVATIENYQRQVKFFTSRLGLRQQLVGYEDTRDPGTLAQLQQSLDESRASLPELTQITLADPDGTVVASTDRTRNGSSVTGPDFTAGKTGFTPSKSFPVPGHQLLIRQYGPLVLNGELIGVVEFTFSADSLLKITSDHAGLGQTGELLIVMRGTNGDVVAITPQRFQPDSALKARASAALASRPAVQAVEKHNQIFTNLSDYRGQAVLAATRYVPSTDWGLVVKIDKAEAFRPIHDLERALLIFGVLFTLVVTLLILEITRTISRPLLRITETTRKISAGKLKERVKIASHDEIGQLGASVNEMAEKLGNYQTDLERKVEERTARLRAITDSAIDAIVSGDSKGHIISWNEGARRMFGYTEKQLIGKPIALIMPERFRARHQAGLERLAAGGKATLLGKSIELIGLHKKHGEFPIELALSAWEVEGGRFFTGIIRDFTVRKKNELRIAQLASIVESSDDAIISKDLSGKILSWNRGAEKLYGYTAEEAVGQPITLLAAADRDTETTEILNKVKEGMYVEQYETFRKHKDGTLLDIDLTVSPIYGEDGSVIGAAATARDVSERRRNELRAAQLASIVESSGDAIISIGQDGKVMSWNQGATKLFGYTAKEMIGQSTSRLSPAEEQEDTSDLQKSLMHGDSVTLDTQIKTKSGRLMDTSLTLSPITGTDGNVIAASMIGRDISGQEELRRRQRDFVSIASHELRTPLTALIGYLSMVNLEKAADQAGRFIDRAGAAARRLSSLVEDLLSVARIEEERVVINFDTVAPGPVLDELIPTFQIAAEQKNIDLMFDNRLSDKDIIRADRGKLDQIFINLIDNAIKYTHPDGSVAVTASATSRLLTMKVADTGIGIDKDNLTRIFDRFYREYSELSVSAGGTGLGLFITKELVERQGGDLKITSRKGKGTTATLRFPVAKPDTTADQPSA